MYKQEPQHLLIGQLLTLLNAEPFANAADYGNALEIKSFIDELPGGFLIYRADSEEILYANRALIRIFGCSSFAEFQALTGNSFRGMVYGEDLDKVEISIEEQIAASQDDLDYVEYRIATKSGDIRWVEDYGHFVHTKSSGDIFYVFITDATEKIRRREREKSMLMSTIEEYDKERTLIRQEHLRRLEVIEGLSVDYVSILYADLDSDKLLPYRLSPRIEMQYEGKLQVRPYSVILANYIEQWVHPDDKESVRKQTDPDYIRSRLATEKTYYFNYRYVEEGETKYMQMRIVDVGNKDRVSQVVLGIRSIDEEILQEIKQKQILQDALGNAKLADVAKNAFLSNMSHDMRTPLNAVLGYLMLAQNSLGNETLVASYLDKIGTASRQILDLVEKVLEFSYAESQDAQISDDECNLPALIAETYENLRPRFESKHIAFSCDVTETTHPDVYADREKLKTILRHLIGNAVKFTKEGNVSVTLNESIAANGFSKYSFIVRDTGTGIEKSMLGKIFEPFERENNTTMSGMFGTGLGLTICKQLTEMMGGTIEVQSEPGRGSTFTVGFMLRVREDSARDEEADAAALQGGKILLVEDNEINREIETEILQNFGFLVEPAENGQIAVDKISAARRGEYDLVLMDIQMPVMDGRTAAQAIRALPDKALAEIPIIALSANAFESDKRASLECGMNEHLPKPLDVDLLLKTIAQILADRKA